jgi:hypothetical protein
MVAKRELITTGDADDVRERESYAERLELVYQYYERTLDLETALHLVPMSEDVRDRLRSDEELQALMTISRARRFEGMIAHLTNIVEDVGEKSGVRLSAIKELGRILIPEKFKERVEVDAKVEYKVIPFQRV